MRDDRERLLDIMEAIERIERYSGRGRSAFEREELIQVWMAHYVQLIGEAAAGLSDDFVSRHPEVPWRQIVGMRNILVHVYFRVDLDEVWTAVERDVPLLKSQIESILASGTEDEPPA